MSEPKHMQRIYTEQQAEFDRLRAINAELLEACKDAKRQIEMMIHRMPLANMAASDSEMLSRLVNVLAKAEPSAL